MLIHNVRGRTEGWSSAQFAASIKGTELNESDYGNMSYLYKEMMYCRQNKLVRLTATYMKLTPYRENSGIHYRHLHRMFLLLQILKAWGDKQEHL